LFCLDELQEQLQLLLELLLQLIVELLQVCIRQLLTHPGADKMCRKCCQTSLMPSKLAQPFAMSIACKEPCSHSAMSFACKKARIDVRPNKYLVFFNIKNL
jgi:hypothetical protein